MSSEDRLPRGPRYLRGQPAGTVVGLTSRGYPLLRSDHPPSEGVSLASEDGSFHGRVQRVFGPVSRPYVVVEPKGILPTPRGAALIGQSLWPEVRSHGR